MKTFADNRTSRTSRQAVTRCGLGRRSARPSRKPCLQLRHSGAQSSSRLAFAFDEPRPSVIHRTATSPAMSRASHFGTRMGGLAPTSSARYGSHSEAEAGSSSVML